MKFWVWLTLACAPAAAADAPWIDLFNGKNLDGWEVCNGYAKYRVENGEIAGTTAKGSPNSFLCSKTEYGDFVLEFETKTDPSLNSGVQIRSHRYAADTKVRTFDGKAFGEHTQKAGRFYGYQVEIANEQSGDSGGIYDEARRGWVHQTSGDAACRGAFKDSQWNRYRVEAIGDHIRTWVNDIACADLVDPLDQSGFIGLQVHGYDGPKTAEVRWRRLRLQNLGRHVWKPIWDGKTMTGWAKRGGATWAIEDGSFHGKATEDPSVGYVISDASYANPTARVKYRIAKGNSGFFFGLDDEMKRGYEVEIDAAKRSGGFWEVGRRNWVTGPEDNAFAKEGEWNEASASVAHGRIVFHLNGVKTVDIPDPDPIAKTGRMAIQCHGSKMPSEVWFKDIEILVPEK